MADLVELGLRLYDFSDTTFSNLRQINLPGSEADLIVTSDSMVFIASGSSVYALTYDDTSITSIDSRNFSPAFPVDVAVGPDNIVFVATQGNGIWACTFTDSTSFTVLDHVTDPITADGIAVGPDSIIYVAGRDNGFYAFSFYNDSSFTQRGHINVFQAWEVDVSQDGTIYLANGSLGLGVYSLSDTGLVHITQWPEPPLGSARKVDIAPDGTIFLANGVEGLRAFTFDGSVLLNTAHINTGGTVYGVAVGANSEIFAASHTAGWIVFSYDQTTSIISGRDPGPDDFVLAQNYPNPFMDLPLFPYLIAFRQN